METKELNQRIEDLLVFFDLVKRADDRVGTFSKGMKQRLALARVMLHDPAILFLDEPTSGLDPEAARQVHDWIAAVRQREGKTVVLCSHNLVEAQRLCDRLVILKQGNILDFGSLQELHTRHSSGVELRVNLWYPFKVWICRKSGLFLEFCRQIWRMNVRCSSGCRRRKIFLIWYSSLYRQGGGCFHCSLQRLLWKIFTLNCRGIIRMDQNENTDHFCHCS